MADARDKQQQQASLMGFGFAAAAPGADGDLFDGLPLDYAFLDTPRAFALPSGGGTKENNHNISNATPTATLPLEPAPIHDPFGLTPRMSAHLLSTVGGGGGGGSDELMSDHMLFDHDVTSNGISGTTPRMSMTSSQQQLVQQRQEDLLTPLHFSFSPSPVRVQDAPPRYHSAPQHKHKRVRSNPDVIFSFQHALSSGLDPVTELEPATMTATAPASIGPAMQAPAQVPAPAPAQVSAPAPAMLSSSATASPVRPSITSAVVPARGRTVSNELANAVFSSILNDFQDPPTTPQIAPIGPVQVTTPPGLGGSQISTNPSSMTTTMTTATAADEPSFQDMDAFLQGLSWAELTTVDSANGPQPMDDGSGNALERPIEASPVAYRSQRIHAGVQELKMKRKRPQHARAHSNPVDLLHNLDQFRMLAQQTKQQQQLAQLQQQDPSAVLNPFALPQSSGVVDYAPQLQPMAVGGAAASAPFMQFQVPSQIARGTARSLHDRRASLPSGAGLALGAATGNSSSGGTGGPTSTKVPPRAAARRAQRSTGLSMDLSQMNLGFLAVPEEDFQQQHAPMGLYQQPLPPAVTADKPSNKKLGAGGTGASDAANDEANRKLYKCGRCGQPKVGHICTMPDQRNNWTQVDLDVTKGIKVMRINCHILPVKTRWVTQHEENMRDEQTQQRHVSMLSA